jgi:hypothetical protein
MPRYDRQRRRRALKLQFDLYGLRLENRSTVTPLGSAALGLGALSIANAHGGMDAGGG